MSVQTRNQAAINRIAARYLAASSEGKNFVADVQKALDLLQDAVDIATARTSNDPETGEALADWNSDVAHAVKITRDFSHQIAPLLHRIH